MKTLVKKMMLAILLTTAFGIGITNAGSEHGHGKADKHADSEGRDDDGSIALSAEQKTLARVRVAPLLPRQLDYQVYAPGEIMANGYTSYQVTPRVDSIILQRHAALGDHIEVGQPLVTLFSESVAQAQAEFRVANSEWQRVQQLGRKAVGEKRYVSTQSEFAAA
tara:strand:+ start:34945 stop:35439 length:495 start_codon:yes stop_codon:yes gene_type:complete